MNSQPQSTPSELYGLLLSGGESRRMGQDKGLLPFDGEAQITRGMRLLSGLCAQVFLSCRTEQADNLIYINHPQVHDLMESIGPMGGIISAFKAHPGKAWLVLACDMPLVTLETLQLLTHKRQPACHATVFLNPDSNNPEPLCAIYEPGIFPALLDAQTRGRYSLIKLLIESNVTKIPIANPQRLRGANTPDELSLLQTLDLQP